MKTTKSHLTVYEREKLEYLRRTQLSVRAIARIMHRDHSVLSRELRRNATEYSGYRAATAQVCFERRWRKKKRGKFEKFPVLRQWVVGQLRDELSPEQISGRLKCKPPVELQGITVSHETIYHYIYEGEGRYELLYRYLKRGRPKRQRKFGRKHRRSLITERISIHQRPEEITSRTTFGHWESDSMIFSKQHTALSVQCERKSRLVRIHKVPDKSSEATHQALRETIESLPQTCFQSITFDNGLEGQCHYEIKKEYGVETYFCDPYSSWQKGTVENTNGLVRYYLPRSVDLGSLSDQEIYEIQEKINNRPRKCLNYLTPNEVVAQFLA